MPNQITLTPEVLITILAALMSLAFAYVPKLKDWYSGLESVPKALVMAVGIVGVAVFVFVANCGSFLIVVNLTCSVKGLTDLLWFIFLALTANQGTYSLLVRPNKN